jgi:hypothetical protein
MELSIGESIWRFLFKGDQLGNLYKCLDVDRPRSAYDYWDYCDVSLEFAVSLEGVLKWLVDGVYVVYDRLCFTICRIFTFNEL